MVGPPVAAYNSAVDPVRGIDDQFLAEFDDVLSWAAYRGITSHTRFHFYRKNIEWLRAHDGKEERPRVHAQLASEERLTEILSTMTESVELVETIPALRRLDRVIPKQLPQTAFSGPADMSREDDASNGARNAMFEYAHFLGASTSPKKPLRELSASLSHAPHVRCE